MRAAKYSGFLVAGITALSGLAFYAGSNNSGWKEIPVATYDKLIEKATAFFEGKNTSFSVEISVSSYKTHQTPVPFETQQAYLVRSGKNYHHYMMGIHSYQNKNYRFVVDSTEKNIMIANPGNVETEKISMAGYNQFHQFIKKVYRIEGKETDRIKLEFDEKIKVSQMEMEFDKKGMIRKCISYFRIKLREDPTDKTSPATAPRIETIFRNYRANIQTDYRKEFDESNYFTVVNGKFVPVKAYADYKIKDTRLKTK